jgi:hypothetical protein
MPATTTSIGVLLSLQLAASPPPPPPPPTPAPASAPAAGGSDLAAEAPVPAWTPEGGSAAHKSTDDTKTVNKKIRNAARTTIAGGSLGILGLVAGISGTFVYAFPRKKLGELKSENGGTLPPDDPKRQRAITMVRVGPYIAYAGAGVFVLGTIMAVVAGRRFKKLREDKRTSVAFEPMPMRRGFGLGMGVRF